MKLSSIPAPVWYIGGGALLLWLMRRKAEQAAQAVVDLPKQAGEKLSAKIHDVLHPELRAENWSGATVLRAKAVKRQQGRTTWNAYTCPPGYRYKKTARGEHLCFRIE